MPHVVGTTAYLETFPFPDTTGALVSGKVNANWTKKVKRNGATSAATVTVTEDSDDAGYYAPSLTPDAVGDWTVILVITHNNSTYRFSESFEVVTAAQADPLAAPVADYARDTLGGRVALLGSGASVVTSPVSADGETMTLTQGDDYTVASGQPIVHTEPVGGPSWPILTDATARLVITNRVNASVIDETGTVVTATGTGKSVRFELTAAQTSGLHVGDPAYYFAVVVTLADASERTLVRGAVAVERDARP